MQGDIQHIEDEEIKEFDQRKLSKNQEVDILEQGGSTKKKKDTINLYTVPNIFSYKEMCHTKKMCQILN